MFCFIIMAVTNSKSNYITSLANVITIAIAVHDAYI